MVNHGLAARLASGLLLLRSLGRLLFYRKVTSSLSAGIRALKSLENVLFCNLIEVFFLVHLSSILCMMELFFARRVSLRA